MIPVGAFESGATGIAEAGMAANPNSATIADVRSALCMSFPLELGGRLIIARRFNLC